jgi:nitrile hydratase accessory protein
VTVPQVPGLPCDAEGPVFAAPWQAQAFAMTLALHERGLFSWPEWAQALAARIRAEPAAAGEDAGDAYYRQWLGALEDMAAARGATSPTELVRYQQAWDHAADRTPHGQPIELRAEDFPPPDKA